MLKLQLSLFARLILSKFCTDISIVKQKSFEKIVNKNLKNTRSLFYFSSYTKCSVLIKILGVFGQDYPQFLSISADMR